MRASHRPRALDVRLSRLRPGGARGIRSTLLLLTGDNPKIVSERLGHASVQITLDRYSHVLPRMQKEVARKLDRMFG